MASYNGDVYLPGSTRILRFRPFLQALAAARTLRHPSLLHQLKELLSPPHPPAGASLGLQGPWTRNVSRAPPRGHLRICRLPLPVERLQRVQKEQVWEQVAGVFISSLCRWKGINPLLNHEAFPHKCAANQTPGKPPWLESSHGCRKPVIKGGCARGSNYIWVMGMELQGWREKS